MARFDDSGQRLEVACPVCGAVNRVPVERLHQGPACDRCAETLEVAVPVTATDSTFEGAIMAAAVPVLVDFWAPWCGPCRTVGPAVAEVARSQAGQALVLKVDTDQNPRVAGLHKIRSIPSLLVFRHGVEAHRGLGAMPASKLLEMLG